MADKEPPTLHEALRDTEEEHLPPELRRKQKSFLPDTAPPPPIDWISHPVTRTIGFLILVIVIAFLLLKGPGWFEYLKAHPYGLSLVIVGVVAAITILTYSYWRTQARGDRGDAWWHSEDIKKEE
jgi:uncharacterized membrane protein